MIDKNKLCPQREISQIRARLDLDELASYLADYIADYIAERDASMENPQIQTLNERRVIGGEQF